MAQLPPAWDEFIATVEGRAGGWSSVLVDGVPVLSRTPEPRSIEPDPKLLSDLLRAGTPLPDKVRMWLADLIDPDADIAMQLSLGKRDGGRPHKPVDKHWDVAGLYLELTDKGGDHRLSQKQALHEIKQSSDLSKSTILAAVADLRSAKLEDQKLIDEEFR